MRDYHYGVYIGRFQPLHVGHEHVIRQALEKVDTLIIIVGSSHMATTPVNPFTFEERQIMIQKVFGHEVATGRIVIQALYDYEHDYDWAANLKSGVDHALLQHANKNGVGLHGLNDFKVALAGFGKDASSYYLNMFPEWGSIQIDTQHGTINASDIRYDYFRRLPRLPHDAVSPRVVEFLKEYALTERFRDLVVYTQKLIDDRIEFGSGPFLAADCLVTWRGKVLLVTRGKAVGRGTLAMPGGFVDAGETFLQAAIRELKEETTLENLEDYIIGTRIVDTPKRSLRGRIVSRVFWFDIPPDIEVPRPVGSDDAEFADWYDFDKLGTERFYEDHHTIITNTLAGE